MEDITIHEIDQQNCPDRKIRIFFEKEFIKVLNNNKKIIE